MKGQCLYRYLPYLFFVSLTLGSPTSRPSPAADYWTQRSRILIEESHSSLGGKLQFGYGERAANDILMAAKEEEVSKGFQNPGSFLPARNFMTVVEDIRRSETFQIIRQMPKGAALHIHYSALGSAKYIYENITFRDNLHVCLPEDGSIDFRFLLSADNDTTCTSSKGWELLADLRSNATIAEDVNTLIWHTLTMVVPDPATAYPDIKSARFYFSRSFKKLNPLLTYLPVYVDYYYQGLTELYEDNVFYLEIRSGLPPLYDLDGRTYGRLDAARIYKTTTERFINDHPDFIGAKLIVSLSRAASVAQVDEYLRVTAALKQEFPDFVAGFDVAGNEEKGEPLIRFADKLKTIAPDIRLFLHAGETKWNGLSTDENLIDAVLLNTTRIGHGYALLKHPRVLEIVAQHEIAIEVNPISNQVLKLVDDMRDHPASFLFARDYPVVISSDDPRSWGAVGLSYDFYEAFVGIMSRHADIRALKQLAMNSIKYSAMSNEEKIRAYEMWENKWTTFIANLVLKKA